MEEILRRLFSYLKWLYPGMQVKRWMFLMGVGILILATGLVVLFKDLALPPGLEYLHPLWGLVFVVFGAMATAYGFRKANRSIVSAVSPEKEDKIVELVYSKRYLTRRPKFVVIGGGTGLHNLLRGLKNFSSNLNAVVTVADDGGSSGRLRRELSIPPPGDIRNCLAALAEAEPQLGKLLQFRFQEGEELRGHNMGNLLIAAMTQMAGSFDRAVEELSRVLAIRGRVLPSALTPVNLVAIMADGSVIQGESDIPHSRKRIVDMRLNPAVKANPQVLESIREADYIVLGPGSLFTSIVPNLLVEGVADAIHASPAVKIYVCNIMTQPGETDDFTAEDHLRIILKYLSTVEFMIINRWVPNRLKRKYESEGAYPVKYDVVEILKMGVRPVVRELVDIRSEFARHDPSLLAQTVMEIAGQARKSVAGGG